MYATDSNDQLLPMYCPSPTNGEDLSWTDLLSPYLRNATNRIYRCPSDEDSDEISYGLNEFVFLDRTVFETNWPNRLTDLHNPSATVMIGDLGTADDFSTQLPDTLVMLAPSTDIEPGNIDSGRPCARHSDRCNLNMMDGHGQHLPLDQFYLDQTPEDLWFNP